MASGYTDISKFGMINEAVVNEFNDLCSRLRREPRLRNSWKNIKVEPEQVNPEIREVYARRQESSRKVLGDAVEKFV